MDESMVQPAVTGVWKSFTRSSTRISQWESLAAATSEPGFVEAHSSELCRLVLESLEVFRDSASQRVVLRTMRHCLRHGLFLKEFTATLVKLESSKLSPQAAFILLRWSGHVLRHLDPVADKKAVVKVIECQAVWLELLTAAGMRWGAVQPVVDGAIASNPALFTEYLQVAAAKGSAPLACALFTASRRTPQQAATASQALLQMVVDKVLSARERPADHILSCYRSLLGAATLEQVSAVLLPAAVRMIKRSPEAALGSVAFMLGALSLDLSAAAGEVMPALLQQARHAKENVRRLAVQAVRALAGKVGDPEALHLQLGAVRALLDGSAEGKIKSSQERASLAAVIEALASAPGRGASVAAAAAAAADFLSGFYKEEITEEVLLALLAALGAWLPRCTQLAPAAVARLSEGLKEKEVLRRAHLRALLRALSSNVEVRGQAAELVPQLAKLVQEGSSKVVARVDGVLALLAAAYISSADASSDEALTKQGVWAALASDSPLIMPAMVAKLAPEDGAAAAELAGVLLTLHAGRLGGECSPAAATASRTLVLLLLHHSRAVRAAASAAAAAVVAASPTLNASLLAALQHWVSSAADVSVVQDPSEGDVPIALEAVHERYLHALLACLPEKGSPAAAELAPGLAAAALLLAHHPMVAAARKGGGGTGTWQAVCRRTGSADSALAVDPEEVARIIVDGPNGVSSATDRQRAAAFGALRSAARSAAPQLFGPVMAALAPLLDRGAHDSLTTRQLRVYATSPGRVSNENEDGSMIPAELFEALLMDKRGVAPPVFPPPAVPLPVTSPAAANGTPSGRSSAASKSASSAASAKGKGGKPKDAAVEAREAQLAYEAEIRAGVVAVREELARGLTALGAFASGSPSFTAARLGDFSAPVIPLLTSPLVGDTAAFDCLHQLAACLPGALGFRALDVAAALRVVAQAEQDAVPDYQRMAARDCVAASVWAMHRATGGRAATAGEPALLGSHALPAFTYTFCFPILRAVMSCPEPTPLHEAALSVLALHVGPESAVPKPQAFALLYRLLEILPAYRDRVQNLLRTLCSSLAPDDSEGLRAALLGVTAAPDFVRAATLHALAAAPAVVQHCVPADATLGLLWMARCDPSQGNAEAGKALWEESGSSLPPTFVEPLILQLSSAYEDVRTAAAAALAAGVAVHPSAVSEAQEAVLLLYRSQPGRAGRLGAAAALRALAPHLSSSDLSVALDFLLSSGLVDSDAGVRSAMVAAGVAVVDAAGQQQTGTMLPLFESYLDGKSGAGAGRGLNEAQLDRVREGAVVFLGTLARHLDPTNPKVRSIVDTLVAVLTTPSESVQRSVSDCLPPLMQALQGDPPFVEQTVAALLERALKGEGYGDRRGAAFGLAGAVKGLGLSSLKGHGIMDALKVAIENKADANAREGSLLCLECLSDKLGRLFEPYVIHVLPMLLVCFGDASPQVREATDGAARVIMGQLSAAGVKLVLPALLQGVEDRLWRTKLGSIQLLGAMAHCAPRQLSACLPAIVPCLGGVLADPHPKVAAAAKTALDEVGSVIRNPEVARLVPSLLAAVADPAKNNKACLDTLLNTVFVNTVDAPSLALIVPVVHRGLKDRSGDVKKRAARIVGNLCALINDPKDMQPYVALLIPELRAALVDPLPEVRATSAKALGSLTGGMGDAIIGDMAPWLLETMRSEASAVERSGAAQGLAEVLAARGSGALPTVLPEVLTGCRAKLAAAREGSLTLFKYLPYCMPHSFQPYLPDVLPFVLGGLADEAEGVRDAALAAGRVAVELYAASALPLLLPTVEAGVANANWRIRQSSVELLGDLLFKVAGTTGRIQQDTAAGNEDDEGISVEAHGRAIIDALGMDRRNEVLARLYMARSDVAYTVRASALHVWKTIVTNTPKTLGEVLVALMGQIIETLAGEGEDGREVAGRCLGELVRKMGERVLAQIVPILKEGMASEEAATRQGVCNGMREVLENATRGQMAEHMVDLLPAVQRALCDDDADVRSAAGSVVNVLFKSGGSVDSIIPALLAGLDTEAQSAQALEGLRVVLGVRPQLLSAVVPRLIKPPVTASNLMALEALADVAGASIHPHLPAILPPLLKLASAHPDASPAAAAAHAALAGVAAAVQEDGLPIFVAEVQKGLEDAGRRRGAAAALVVFCKQTRLDYQEHVPSLLTALLPLLADDKVESVAAVWAALSAVAGSIPKEVAPSFVRVLKEAVAAARAKEVRQRKAGGAKEGSAVRVPGFCLPKALAPVLPIYLQGVLQGSSAELRELAAEGLGELVEVTGEDALKPFVVQITGPLIRIVGDRFPWQTKAAILHSLGLMVGRAGAALRPFVPQLQTTFVKCLADPAAAVRNKAAKNLGELTRMAPRLDQLVSDLATNARTAEPAAQEAYATVLQGALVASGDRLAAETLAKVGSALRGMMESAGDDEIVRAAAAKALGAYAARCSLEELRSLLAAGPLNPSPTGNWGDRLGAAMLAAAVAECAARRVEEAGLLPTFIQALVKTARDEKALVKEAAGKAAGRVVTHELEGGGASKSLPALAPLFVALLGPDQSADTQRHALAVLRRIAAAGPAALEPHYPDLVPSVLSMIQATTGSTKLAAERTLARVLQLDASPEPAAAYLAGGKAGPLARSMLSEAYLRRLSRLPAEDDALSSYDV